jgi:hypothetical protein
MNIGGRMQVFSACRFFYAPIAATDTVRPHADVR